MAKGTSKNQVHLYLLDSTKENIDELTERANQISKKHINRNELISVILTEFINGCNDDALKELLVKYVLA